MTTEKRPPPPPVDADIDLRDFAFMPLDVGRLLTSDWWISACAEEPLAACAAVNLWASSWHQVPASSLPSNEIVLARLAHVERASWDRIRDRVMQPWVLCDDGRYYHKVIAEKAVEAWDRKRKAAKQREETAEKLRRWRDNRKNLSRESQRNDDVTGYNTVTKELRNHDVTSLTGTGTGTGTEKENLKTLAHRGGGRLPDPALKPANEPAHADSDEFEVWWSHYPRKVGKKGAYRAYKAAKRDLGGEGATKLLEAVVAFSVASRGKDPQFLPYPATWLNQGRWDDEAPGPAAVPSWNRMASPAGG